MANIRKPNQFFGEFRKLLQLEGKTILVYRAIARTNDALENTKCYTELPPISLKVLVRDFSANGLLHNVYGLKEIGAKSIIFDPRHEQLFLDAYKIEIDDIEYTVWKDALGSRTQLWRRGDVTVAIITQHD